MEIIKKIDDGTVTYPCNQEVKDAVFNAVIGYFMEYQTFNGESLIQSDAPTMAAPECLADIADDIIKFKTEYND